MVHRLAAIAVVCALFPNSIRAGGVEGMLADLDDPEKVTAAVTILRSGGPGSLDALVEHYDQRTAEAATTQAKYDKVVEDQELAKAVEAGLAQIEQLRKLVDSVAGQRGATVARLFWYTDLDKARTAAAESGKPILSLRMLGKLTDEYSCANSRFFRTALYSNKEISDYLREHYVLHWKSVRPVPRVTIDFGDGRKLQRTVTGNSAHYVLDAAGRPLDVLPGLYGPQAFLEWLERTRVYSQRMAHVAESQRGSWVEAYHHERLAAVNESLRNDLGRFAPELLVDPESPLMGDPAKLKPTALKAGALALTKAAVEMPVLAAFMPGDEALQAQDDALWRRIAADRAAEAKLDEASVEVIRGEHADAFVAGALATSKRIVEDPILRVVRNFEGAMALDTVKNEYLLHRRIHRWYVDGEAPADVDALNEKVYAELFLTPSSDPWLGLAPADAYTALEGGGLTAAE